MAFDPDLLKPIGEPTPIPPEMLGMRQDTYQDLPADRRPTQQWFETPDGQKMVKREKLDGSTYFETERVGERAVRFEQDKKGEWTPSMLDQGGWSQLGKNAYKDGKFMTFLAIVAGGTIASAYAGGGTMASGAIAEGTLPASATAAEAGSGIIGGATAAAPAAAPATSAAGQSAAYSDLAGLEGLSQTGLTTAGSTGAGTGATTAGLDNAATWYSKLFDFGKTTGGGQVLGGIISGVGSGIASYENNKAQLENAQAQRDWASAEADKERQWKARNMNAASMPSIDWKVPRETLKASEPLTTKPLTAQQPLIGVQRG